MKPAIYVLEAEKRKRFNVWLCPRPSDDYANGLELLVRMVLLNTNSTYSDKDGLLNIGWFIMGTKSIPYLRFLLNEFVYNEDFPRYTRVEGWYNFNALFL